MGAWGNMEQYVRNIVYDIKHPSILSTPEKVKPIIYFKVVTIMDGLWENYVVFYEIVKDYKGNEVADFIKIPSLDKLQKYDVAQAVCSKGKGMLKPDALSRKYVVHKRGKEVKNLKITYDDMQVLVAREKAMRLCDFQYSLQYNDFSRW